ncbi:diphthine--ammonia ligase [Candidatus Woesearchaeota archaeon]|nr:diphthine--ammonia ligase [Candidatus Woesearchaeota archaeon]
MCGIIGYFGPELDKEKIRAAFALIESRGKDAYGYSNGSTVEIKKHIDRLSLKDTTNFFLHKLHSIVGSRPQPFKGKGIFIANCEIYNWEELDQKYDLGAGNDAELMFRLIEEKGTDALDEFDGVYAFAYWRDGKVILARDIIGERPIWVSRTTFAFSSEKKVLEAMGLDDAEELNPRKILTYKIKTKEKGYVEREFFKTEPQVKDNLQGIKKRLNGLLTNAISKRVPDTRIGVLFSGGIDSTLIAFILKELRVDFTCYAAGLVQEGLKEAEDLVHAEKIAKELGFPLKLITIGLDEVEAYLTKIVPLIEDSNVVKVGVALPFYLACEEAQKDGVRVIFSGLGSEEIFAGYQRHEQSQDINKECLHGLLKMYERDLYRDDVITMHHNIELRLPFLDKKLVGYALQIPAKYKIKDDVKKWIIREVAKDLGMKAEFAMRKKKAAQYGSNFDKAIQKLAAKQKKSKSGYLRDFYPTHNLKIGVLFSSGKDSTYAMHIMMKQNYEISCLISLKSKNPDSYMFHTPNIDMVKLQSEALGIPLILEETQGEKETELEDLEKAIIRAKTEYSIDAICTGALFSNYQRDRIEKICDRLGLKMFSPLWHKDQELEMREIINEGFKFMMSSVAAEGLDASWLGREITLTDVDKLVQLHRRIGLNVCGEGGEFESLVVDGPIFRKRIIVKESEVLTDGSNAKIIIKQAGLMEKT